MILKCEHCGQKNRVPAERIEQKITCGNCGSAISATGKTIEVGEKAFQDLVDNSPLPVIVDFWAPWCGPCRAVAPEVEKLARTFKNKVVVAKLNTEKNPSIAQREGVRGIPMFGFYKEGKRAATQTGMMSAEQLAMGFDL